MNPVLRLLIVYGFLVGLPAQADLKILPPSQGAYHGAYADFGALEDQVSPEAIENFEKLAGKKIAWAYFSNHWLDGKIIFPSQAVEVCREKGVIPYIRLLPWSRIRHNRRDPIFSMQALVDGKFDSALREWARAARDSGGPMMLEFGPEVNGDWFPWNGRWNGAGATRAYGDPKVPDGPERFRDAYRHVIELFRSEGANQVTWVIHVDVSASPQAAWNDFRYYYPGDEYIDWVGLSAFGAQLPTHSWSLFPRHLKEFLPKVEAVTQKPILISEYAVIEDAQDSLRKAQWIRQALQSVSRGLYKQIKGMSYWHSPGWLPERKANFRIDSAPASLEAYQHEIQQPFWLSDVILGSTSTLPSD